MKEHKQLRAYISECITEYLQEHLREVLEDYLGMDSEEAMGKKEKKKLSEKLEKLQLENQRLQEQIDTVVAEKSKLQDDLTANKKINRGLAQANESLEAAKAAIEEEKTRLEKQLASDRAEYKNAYTKLNNEKDSLMGAKNDLEAQMGALEESLQKVEQAKEALDQALKKYLGKYGRLEAAYQEYLQLQPDIRERELYRLCGPAKSSLGLFAALLQKDNLGTLWEYIAYGINNGQFQNGDEERLKGLFDFCFDTINASQEEPVYQRLACDEGEEYDNRYMLKTSNSRQQGDVKIVALQGYVQISNGKVIKGSLVSLD